MTKTELYTFTTSLLDGLEMEETLFDTFLNIAQMYWENQRPWMILRSEDTSQTISTGNTFETEKSLPTDFRKWYTRFPIVLTDSQANSQQFLREIPISMKLAYKQDISRFYCNYRTNKFYVCGQPSQSLTIRQYYIMKTTLVSASDSNDWDFPTEYHPILALSVATYHKLGIDYDIINNSQASNNAALAVQIYMSMSEWDSDLQNSSIQGQDYGSGQGWTGNSSGGRMSPDIM